MTVQKRLTWRDFVEQIKYDIKEFFGCENEKPRAVYKKYHLKYLLIGAGDS